MAKAPTRAQQAVALAREPRSPDRANMPDARARGFAMLASTIGAIPGCSLGAFSIAPFAGPDGKTATTLTVSGRGPSLHVSMMEWKGRAALDATSPDDVGRSLVAAFATRIERQRVRAEEALATLGAPIPRPIFGTNTECLHLAVDRMSAWAEAREINPLHETYRTFGDRVRLAVAMRAATAAKATIANTTDTGGPQVSEGDFSRIREVRTDAGLLRQVAIKHEIAGITIGGSSVMIPDVVMPETLRLGARGTRFAGLLDASAKLGEGFSRLTAERTILRVDIAGSGIIVDLLPDLIRIDDLYDMTHMEITGEPEPA